MTIKNCWYFKPFLIDRILNISKDNMKTQDSLSKWMNRSDASGVLKCNVHKKSDHCAVATCATQRTDGASI